MKSSLSSILLGLLLSACSSSSPLTETDYRLDYGKLSTDVRFTMGSVTRSGPGFRETNAAKVRTLGDECYFIQWREKNETFVTLLMDLTHLHVYASILPGGAGQEPMFLAGDVIPKR